jgi:hypothetical protein
MIFLRLRRIFDRRSRLVGRRTALAGRKPGLIEQDVRPFVIGATTTHFSTLCSGKEEEEKFVTRPHGVN